MSRGTLQPIFETVGLPVVQGHWAQDEEPIYPFIEYHKDGTTTFMADNRVYYKRDDWSTSVYGKVTDMPSYYESCEHLEHALDDAGIIAERSMDLFPDGDIVYAEYTFSLA